MGHPDEMLMSVDESREISGLQAISCIQSHLIDCALDQKGALSDSLEPVHYH